MCNDASAAGNNGINSNRNAAKAVQKDCGCAARAQKLNEVFPYRKMSNLSNEDFAWLRDWFTEPKNSVTAQEQKQLVMMQRLLF